MIQMPVIVGIQLIGHLLQSRSIGFRFRFQGSIGFFQFDQSTFQTGVLGVDIGDLREHLVDDEQILSFFAPLTRLVSFSNDELCNWPKSVPNVTPSWTKSSCNLCIRPPVFLSFASRSSMCTLKKIPIRIEGCVRWPVLPNAWLQFEELILFLFAIALKRRDGQRGFVRHGVVGSHVAFDFAKSNAKLMIHLIDRFVFAFQRIDFTFQFVDAFVLGRELDRCFSELNTERSRTKRKRCACVYVVSESIDFRSEFIEFTTSGIEWRAFLTDHRFVLVRFEMNVFRRISRRSHQRRRASLSRTYFTEVNSWIRTSFLLRSCLRRWICSCNYREKRRKRVSVFLDETFLHPWELFSVRRYQQVGDNNNWCWWWCTAMEPVLRRERDKSGIEWEERGNYSNARRWSFEQSRAVHARACNLTMSFFFPTDSKELCQTKKVTLGLQIHQTIKRNRQPSKDLQRIRFALDRFFFEKESFVGHRFSSISRKSQKCSDRTVGGSA